MGQRGGGLGGGGFGGLSPHINYYLADQTTTLGTSTTTVLNYTDPLLTSSITIPVGQIFNGWYVFRAVSETEIPPTYTVGHVFKSGDTISDNTIYSVYPIIVSYSSFVVPNPLIARGSPLSIRTSPILPTGPNMGRTFFGDNSLVAYKVNSLPSSRAGTVRNSRVVGRRT